MALIRCPACGRENVSDTALFCPGCGFSIKEYFDSMKQAEKAEKPQGQIIDLGQIADEEGKTLQRMLNEKENQKEQNRKDDDLHKTNKKQKKPHESHIPLSKTAIGMAILIIGLLFMVGICLVKYTSSKEKQSSEKEIEDQISKTRTSVSPYLNVLGEEVDENQTITLSQSAYDNIKKVYVMGEIGTFSHSYSDSIIDTAEWKSNEQRSLEEYDGFIKKLNKYFKEKGQPVVNAENEYYYEENPYDECEVYTRYEGKTIVVSWYIRQEAPPVECDAPGCTKEATMSLIDEDNYVSNYCDDHYQEYKKKKEDTEAKDNNESEETFSYEHVCDDPGCTDEGTHSVKTWDGSIVYYCDYHYKMIEDAADKLENGSYHKCEVPGCSNEGTYSLGGFNGTEYYCYQHYKEMSDAIEKIMGN